MASSSSSSSSCLKTSEPLDRKAPEGKKRAQPKHVGKSLLCRFHPPHHDDPEDKYVDWRVGEKHDMLVSWNVADPWVLARVRADPRFGGPRDGALNRLKQRDEVDFKQLTEGICDQVFPSFFYIIAI